MIASPRTVPHLQDPAQLALYSRGSTTWLFATDGTTHRITRLTIHGKNPHSWSYPAGARWDQQDGVAVSHSGAVYVANSGKKEVDEYSISGRHIRAFAYFDTPTSYVTRTTGVARRLTWGGYSSAVIGRNGDVLVASTGTDAVQESTSRGYFFMSAGMGNEPLSLAQGPGTTAYVVEPCDRQSQQSQCTNGRDYNYLVVRVDLSQGSDIRHWYGSFAHGGSVRGAQPWVSLSNIATDRTGNWYVTGMALRARKLRGIVLEYSRKGRLLRQWNAPPDPRGIVVARDGTVYITSHHDILGMIR